MEKGSETQAAGEGLWTSKDVARALTMSESWVLKRVSASVVHRHA